MISNNLEKAGTMPLYYYSFILQFILFMIVVIYLLRKSARREPEVRNIYAALKNERYDKAYEIAKSRMRLIETSDFTYQQKEIFYMRFRKVIEYLEKKAARSGNLDVLNALGWAYLLTGDKDKALHYLRQAEDIDPGDARVLQNIADAMKSSNWHRKAMTYYRKAIAADPSNKDAYLGKADMAYALEMYKTAREAYLKVIELDAGSKEALFGVAMCFFKTGEYEKAEPYFKKIENKGIGEATVNYSLGKIAYDAGRFEEALGYLEKATDLNFFHAEAYYLKSLIYAAMGERELAIQNIVNAVKIDDTYKETAKNEELFSTYWLFSDFRQIFE